MAARFHLAVVILAAGRARRMGKPKLVLPWHGSTIIAHEIETWRHLADDVRVVCGPRPDPIQDELDRLEFLEAARIENPSPDDGMFSSIRWAAQAQWPNDLSHFAIVLGDQPHLNRCTFEKLLHFAEEEFESICQPRHGVKRGHPVILPRQFFFKLADTWAEKLSDYLADERVELCDVDDPGIEFDINIPADYEAALKVEQLAAHH
jgi:molybdenum cofactor cytidylyltransferase